jgi:hypothetical protein
MKSEIQKEYRPEFSTTRRDGKVALWVKLPNGELYNIWDLSESELTHDVEKAIICSFERGMMACKQLQPSLIGIFDLNFKHEEK